MSSNSVNDASLSIPFVPPSPLDGESIRPRRETLLPVAPPIIVHPPVFVEEIRGRSRSRSPRRLSPPCVYINRHHSRSRTPSSRSPSRSPSPRWRHCSRPGPRSISPAGCPYILNPPRPPQSRSPSPVPIPIQIPPIFPPTPIQPPMCVWPPSDIWQVPKQPVDILTFHYDKNMAYAPATKTYDEAIDNVRELWPELRDVDRDQIRLLVTGSDHLVRVPKMAWSAVLCDVPRYEVVHVQVEPVTPPPQYQGKGKGKGKWGDDNEKGRRSSRWFSSIRRIFA